MDRKAVLKQFAERLQADSALRKELEADPAGVVARETGMTLTELKQQMQHLTDDQLAAVAGGVSNSASFGLEELFRKIFGNDKDSHTNIM